MSLKRKASFPTIASPQSPQNAIDRSFMDDSPKHLHCRTRKRVRDDRPDEQTVYDKTLRWLFTAQQRVQQIPTPPADQDEDMEPESPTPVVDRRQKSLLQFFRPAHSQTPREPCPSTPMSQFSSDVLQGGNDFPHGPSVGMASPATPSGDGTMAPAPGFADRDMDMDMDL
ncbi:uncharacterized protein BDV17DRAFT_221395 [Aspergillus undulatus]|uniref:uncharacterized protein n=1 Tax=Aspergillus undulatus TaxID=1810928 RepID=UPI003CCD3D01